MALESATYISGLVASNPAGSDSISLGDDHLKLIKSVLKTTLPNANAVINGIHSGAVAPTSTSAGQLWYDTGNNILYLRNTADSGWIALLYTDGSSTPVGSMLLSVSHSKESTTSSLRSDSYIDTGWSIAHNKLSATSTLYVHVDGMNDVFSAWDGGSEHQYTYIKLANTSGTLIVDTTDDILVGDIKDAVGSGLSSNEYGFGFSHTWKVTAANCPDGTSGVNTFDIWSKQPTAAGGGTTFVSGTMMVWEIEE